VALILGDDEVQAHTVGVKPLRSDQDQRTVGQAEVPAVLEEFLAIKRVSDGNVFD
jgi:histidyl-tRNA synthetase